MEGVPRVPMFAIPLKSSPVAPDISPIKKKIKKGYGDQVFIDENIFRNFLALRTECCKYPNGEMSLAAIKRYYAHLLLLKNRIDLSAPKLVEWPWQDAFNHTEFFRTEINYEEAAILYGLGAAYSLLGRKESRTDEFSMKAACAHFQCAAWVFQTLRERYGSFTDANDMSDDLFQIYSLISLNQAQECIVEKSIMDNRPSTVTAKLAKYLTDSYGRCASLVNSLTDSVPLKFRKDWSRFLSIKKSYYASLVDFFLAADNEVEMKFGIATAHFKLAQSHIEEAWLVAKSFTDAVEPQIGQGMISTIQFARDVIGSRCANAIKDNSEIYHELVPQPQDLRKTEGACVAKPTAFDPTDPAVIGVDIFKDLLPIGTLEASSVYSEMKASFLRSILAEVEAKDSELDSFLSTLNLDPQALLKPDLGLPQELLDQCAKFNAMEMPPESELSAQMAALVDLSAGVEANLEEISAEIQTAQDRLAAVPAIVGVSKTDSIKGQLAALAERHKKFSIAAGEAKKSNMQLQEALAEHLKAFQILLLPPDEIEAGLPNANDLITDSDLLEGLNEAARILAKVEEMRTQRLKMLENLRNALQADDVTQELLATSNSSDHNVIFQRHLGAHQEAGKLIRLNLAAQENITNALIAAHAEVGVKKYDILQRRAQRLEEIESLIRSGEAFDDLMQKCEEGQAFYRQIGERLATLHSEVEQINSSINNLETPDPAVPTPIPPVHSQPSSTVPADNGVLSAPPSLREVLRARGSKAAIKVPPVASTTSFQIASPTGLGGQPYWRPQVQQQNIPSMVANRAFPTPYAVNQTRVSTPQSQFGPPGGPYPMQTPYQHQSSAPLSAYPPAPQQQEQQPTAAFTYQQQSPVQSYPLPPSMVPQRPGQQYSASMYQQVSSIPPSQTLLSMRTSQHPPSTVQPVMSQQYRPLPPVQSPPSTQLGQQQIANPPFGGQPGVVTMPNLQQYGNASPSFQPPQQPSQNQPRGFHPANPRTPPPPPNQYRPVVPTLQPSQQQGSNSSPVAPNLQQHGTSTSSQVLGSSLPGQQLVQNPPPGVHIGSGPYQYGTPTPSQQSVYSSQTSSLVRTTVENPLKQGPQASRQTLGQFTKQSGNFPWPPQQYYGSQQYPAAYTYSNLTPYNQGFYNPSLNTPPVSSNNSPSLLQAQHQLKPQNQMPLAPQPQGGSVVAGVAPPPNPAIPQSGSVLPSTKSDAEKLPPNEMGQPTAVGHTPQPVASLGATNVPGVDDVVCEAPENLGRTPISPHILTQADLEVQKHEKQLRATYDATVLSLIDSSIVKNNGTTTATSTPHSDPLSDPLALNRFIDATERLLTWLETMNDPPQGGNSLSPSSSRPLTRLDQSWSRVNEIITKRSGNRPTQAAALCAVAKNRRQECIAYDFNRVSLKREPLSKKDDYINASHLNFVSSFGDWCPRYILTQAPLITTVTDFWSMIFDQACELVVLALPPRRRTSLLPSSLDPPESYAEGAYGEPEDSLRVPPHLPPLKVGSRFNVGSGSSALELRLQAVKFTHVDSISQQSPSADSIAQSTCIERILTLRNCCTQQTRTIVHLCYSGLMPTSSDPNSIASFTGFVQTAIGFYKQQRSLMHPIAVVSEDGGGLGGIFVSTSVAVLHAEVLGRVADVCELVGCLCQQRRGVYSQADQLAATCGVVGLAAKQFLARRDIVVGPSLSSVRKSTSISDDAKALENTKQPEGAPQTRAQDFASSLFSDQPLQLSDMMSALGFSPTLSPLQSKESSKSLPVDGASSQPLNAGSAGAGGSSTNALFDDLSPHLANISLTDSGASVSPANRRHYQARDFVDKAYKESRDNLAVDPNVFGDLESFGSQSQSSASKNN